MNTSGDLVGVVSLTYLLHYNLVVAGGPCLGETEPVNGVITGLMEKHSRYFLIQNILARVLYILPRYTSFTTAKGEAENIIFREYQKSEKDYILHIQVS